MRRLSLILALALTFATFTTVNAAIPKSGGSCAKKGLVSIYKNKKYTCIKSGNKFIWDSGFAFQPKNPAPLPSISSSAVPTPSNSPTTQPSATPTGPKSGDICANIGSRFEISKTSFLECRMVAKNQSQWIILNLNPVLPTNNVSLGNIKDCQVSDQTNRSRFDAQAAPIGYMPDRRQSLSYPTQGNFNIVILPIDFKDFPGSGLDESELLNYSKIIETWFNYESNGKLKVSVSYVNKWLRAPKLSHDYNWNHPGTQNPTSLSDDQIGQDFADIADNYVDFHNVGAIFVMHPDRIPNIEYGMMANTKIQTSEGFVSPFLVSNGYNVDRQDGAIWSYWIHELGHHLGFVGHAPDELRDLDLMDNQSGFGLATSTWNQLLVDWLLPTQLYCRSIGNLISDNVTLTSVDSLSDGVKSAMIAMSSHEVLVIESRRKDFWTTASNTFVKMKKEAFDGFYGIAVYLVDTSKINDPNIDRMSPQFDPSIHKFARYLTISNEHLSRYKDVEGLEYLMFLGESIIFRNVKISLVNTGDFDTIKIEKI